MSVHDFPLSSATLRRLESRGLFDSVDHKAARKSSTISRWLARYRERRALRLELEMTSNALLRDMGLTRREALSYARRPFWRD